MWKLTDGYVIILVTGKQPEGFLNLLGGANIPLWDVEARDRNSLKLTVRAGDFKHIRPMVKKSRCRVHILSRRGPAFSIMRLLRRPVLLYGALTMLLSMGFLSTRILVIHVTGTEKIPDAVILRALKGQGLTPFCARPKGVTLLELAQNARMYDSRIGWIGLRLHGVVLTADVVETSPDVPLLDPTLYCHVVAVKDGVIKRLRVYAGRAAVEEGARVRAGDVLISGAFLGDSSKVDQLEIPMRVHARGEALALVTYRGEYAAEKEEETLLDTGETAPYRTVELCGRILLADKPPFEQYEVRDVQTLQAGNFLLPVRLVRGVYYERTLGRRPLTEAEQKEQALQEAEQLAFLKVPQDAAIVEKQAEIIETEGLILGRVTIITQESIGLEKELEH